MTGPIPTFEQFEQIKEAARMDRSKDDLVTVKYLNRWGVEIEIEAVRLVSISAASPGGSRPDPGALGSDETSAQPFPKVPTLRDVLVTRLEALRALNSIPMNAQYIDRYGKWKPHSLFDDIINEAMKALDADAEAALALSDAATTWTLYPDVPLHRGHQDRPQPCIFDASGRFVANFGFHEGSPENARFVFACVNHVRQALAKTHQVAEGGEG